MEAVFRQMIIIMQIFLLAIEMLLLQDIDFTKDRQQLRTAVGTTQLRTAPRHHQHHSTIIVIITTTNSTITTRLIINNNHTTTSHHHLHIKISNKTQEINYLGDIIVVAIVITRLAQRLLLLILAAVSSIMVLLTLIAMLMINSLIPAVVMVTNNLPMPALTNTADLVQTTTMVPRQPRVASAAAETLNKLRLGQLNRLIITLKENL